MTTLGVVEPATPEAMTPPPPSGASRGWMEIMGWPIMVVMLLVVVPVRLTTGGEAAVTTEAWLMSSGVMYWERGRISLGASFTPAASGDWVWDADSDSAGDGDAEDLTPAGDWTI